MQLLRNQQWTCTGALDAIAAREAPGGYAATFAGAFDGTASGIAAMCAEQLEATTLWATLRETPP